MKKYLKIGIGVVLLIGLAVFIFTNISTNRIENVENEIKPQAEIDEESELQTKIKLCFADKVSGILRYEERKINAKDLVENPYYYVIDLLIKGPEDEELKEIINSDTKINSVKFNKGILTIDLSKEFLETGGMDGIYSIVNSMTDFNEVEKIKISASSNNDKATLNS